MLNKNLYMYGLLLGLLSGCGDGSAGGAEQEVKKTEQEAKSTILVNGTKVRKYATYKEEGDRSISINLSKKGFYLIGFAYEETYKNKKDAIVKIKKNNKTIKYVVKKPTDNKDLDSMSSVRLDIQENEEGIYEFEVNVPLSDDKWNLSIVHNDDFPEDLKDDYTLKNNVRKIKNKDILYDYQWHLKNTGQNSYSNINAVKDEDINVESVWNGQATGKAVKGKGVKVAVIDEGVEINHPDLVENIDLSLSWNYLSSSYDTTPKNIFNAHGTAVAGIIAAKGWNGIGGRGVAPEATIVSYNMIDSQSLTKNRFDLAYESLTRNIDKIDIYNNSWGFDLVKQGARKLIENKNYSFYKEFANQLKYGTKHGRPNPNDPNNISKKRGAIYVKASGNDGYSWNANYNPEQVERYMIVVGASGADGKPTGYTTPGENVLLSAPGGGSQKDYLKVNEQMIVTTDLSGNNRGYDNEASNNLQINHFNVDGNENYDYTNRMNGTSSSGPIVSGVVALMLEENPNLTWREVRYILVKTAQSPSSNRNNYNVENLPPLKYSPYLGFGRVNATLAVQLAKYYKDKNIKLNDELNKEQRHIPIYSDMSKKANANANFDFSNTDISKTEYVNVEFTINEVSQVEYKFDNSKITGDVEDGVYTITFNITNVKDSQGQVLNIPNASISIGSDVTIPLNIEGGAIKEKIVLKNQKITAGTKNITPNFAGNAVKGSKWSMTIKKGSALPPSNKFEVSLTSSDGSKAVIVPYYKSKKTNGLNPSTKFYKTRFGINRFLDKNPKGIWKLNVEAKDLEEEASFLLKDLKVEIYGR